MGGLSQATTPNFQEGKGHHRFVFWNRKDFIDSNFIGACLLPGLALLMYHNEAPEVMAYH